ncbi:MAG: 50S ribosomal protein L11 methyltransferase [Polyangiaceae bacterium]|nr:50S ribosomal protein L11 methyltransferase [Polyangiaceae bacterium]
MSQPPSEPRFPYVSVRVPAARAAELCDALFEVGATGIEERDHDTHPAEVEAGAVCLVASFDAPEQVTDALAELRACAPELAWERGEIVGDAWRDKYKEHFAPFALTATVTVVPPWVQYTPARPEDRRLELDPGRAFGTGLHATTSLCAAYLEERRTALVGQSVLDVGTGSGILALVALLLGAARATGLDVDPDALEVARENAARNAVGGGLALAPTPVADVAERFAFVVANIEARTLVALAPALVARLAPGGELLLSGVLAAERDEVAAAFTRAGLTLLATRARGDGGDAWTMLVFEHPA